MKKEEPFSVPPPKPKELTVDKEAIRKAQKENPRKTVRVKSILP